MIKDTRSKEKGCIRIPERDHEGRIIHPSPFERGHTTRPRMK